jgi:hypothetical protein
MSLRTSVETIVGKKTNLYIGWEWVTGPHLPDNALVVGGSFER